MYLSRLNKTSPRSLCSSGFFGSVFIASLYAAEFPENVEKMILISPADVVKMPSEDKGLFEQIKRYLPEEQLEEYNEYLDRYLDYKKIFSKNEDELALIGREFLKYYALALEKKGKVLKLKYFLFPIRPRILTCWLSFLKKILLQGQKL